MKRSAEVQHIIRLCRKSEDVEQAVAAFIAADPESQQFVMHFLGELDRMVRTPRAGHDHTCDVAPLTDRGSQVAFGAEATSACGQEVSNGPDWTSIGAILNAPHGPLSHPKVREAMQRLKGGDQSCRPQSDGEPWTSS